MWPEPITLRGQHIMLAPLSLDHADDLAAAAKDLKGLWYTSVPEPDGIAAEIERRFALHSKGLMLPFALIASDGTAVGMTTYMNIDTFNKRVEIGSTWIARKVQRSGVNSEAKFLLLQHAFENLGCIAVEFRTHVMNAQSRRAIERLGAKLDGVLRNHMIADNGTLRDSAVYSILPHEWPSVRANLEWQLSKPR